jgi:ATP-dependent RNA helicase DeaD
MRHWARARPAPELLIGSEGDVARVARPRLAAGVWFSVNCGRAGRAEVRWLLPLICRLGHVTKKDIGRIQVRERDTRFEISAAAAAGFAAAAARACEAGVEIRPAAAPGEP